MVGSATIEKEYVLEQYLDYIRNDFVDDVDRLLGIIRYSEGDERARCEAEDRLVSAFSYLFQEKGFPADLLGGRLVVGAGRLAWYIGSKSEIKLPADGVCSWLYWREGHYRVHAKAYRNERARLVSLFESGGEGNALMIAAGMGDLKVMPWSIVLLGENVAARSRRLAEWLYCQTAFVEDIGEQLQNIRWRDPVGIYEAYYLSALPSRRR